MLRNDRSHLHLRWEHCAVRRAVNGILLLGLGWLLLAAPGRAQSNSGSIEGVVKDPSGSSVAGATVEISYLVSGYSRTTTTGTDGTFRFTNVPLNTYHTVVTAPGFASYTQDVDVRSTVPVSVAIGLKVGSAASTSVTVEANGGDLVENESTLHTDVDRDLFDKLPLESAVVVSKLAGDAFDAGSRGGFERAFPRIGRSRGKLLFARWPADHGSAKQSFLESDSYWIRFNPWK